MPRRLEKGFLVIIFLLSLTLRLTGLGWGLPYQYDNIGSIVISHAVGFFNGNFNPGWFIYPSFHMYFLFVVYKLIYWIGTISGHFSSLHQFRSLFETDPSLFIIVGRVVAALLSSGSVILGYILAKRLSGQKVAFLALLLAISPAEVVNSHYTVTDIPMTFWFLLAFIFCSQIMEKSDLRYYILAGIFTGIAAGTKYPGLGAISPLITAHLIRLYRWKKRWKTTLFSKEIYKLIIAAGVVALTFFISTPYSFLDYQHSLPNIIGEFKIRYTSLDCIYSKSNTYPIFFYIKAVFYNFGFLFTILGLLGVAVNMLLVRKGASNDIKKISREEVLLLSWIIPFAIIFTISKFKMTAYFLTLSPFLVIFLANAIVCLKERFDKKFAWSRYATISLALLIPLQPLYHSIKNDIILTRPDTREEAHDWIIKNIPKGTVIAKEELWTPYLPKNRYNIVYSGWSLGDHEIAWYKERKVEYFLISKNMKDLMFRPDRAPLHRQFYKDLENEACLIYKVSPKDKALFMEFHNTTVLIYKAKDRFQSLPLTD